MSLLRKQSKYKPEQNALPDIPVSYEMEKHIIDKFIKEDLEGQERTIIRYLYEGYTQREIAKLLNTTQPRICQRIRELRIKGKRKWGNVT